MNLGSLIGKITGGSKVVENVTGLFVGENSKKRQMGFIGFAISILLFQFGAIDETMFDALMVGCTAWVGVAFSSKLSKIGDAVKEGMKK